MQLGIGSRLNVNDPGTVGERSLRVMFREGAETTPTVMPNFKCKILTRDGQSQEKTLIAQDRSVLRAHLEREGLFVVQIRRSDGLGAMIKGGVTGKRVRLKDLMTFNQEFSVLIRAGMPILAALDVIIEKRGADELTRVLSEVRNAISGGASLSDAFGRHGHLFGTLYVSSLRAGEKSGNVGPAITRYVEYVKKVMAIRKKIVTASVYPVILTTVSIFAVFFLLIYVVPSFTGTYFEAGTELPGLTQALIGVSERMRSLFPYLLLLAILLVLGCRAYSRTAGGRAALDKAKLGVPLLGTIFADYSLAKMARTLATVLHGGLTLLDSLRISAGTLDNRYLEEKLDLAAADIEKGTGFSEAISKTGAFPKLAVRLLEAGERSGALEQVLNEIADFYESEIDARLSILTSSIEPALMVVMGLLIGFIVLAMYMPIFQMAGTIR